MNSQYVCTFLPVVPYLHYTEVTQYMKVQKTLLHRDLPTEMFKRMFFIIFKLKILVFLKFILMISQSNDIGCIFLLLNQCIN